ncbi:permease prefix domain 1-containing protein [Treponema zuelzerae]|uniref:Permease prefix domain 1-containing protein n=1 Tax=Teretinema zuelzerae TaxID=156 RepID=A0AAE3EHI0_9SPIR|nr:permease prefix domain 1-containing protein [Teretinema zuelzerae]MCD1655085.1 permease prefix domain 1-containing protein [Teretinema zuelzerae]HPO01934.1 permease prefix domain 1-containing protein [Treponemataceae bacterium]
MDSKTTDAVRYYVCGLFRGMQETPRIAEQREELQTHMTERIADETASGSSFDEAFNRAVASLGDLEELMETMSGQKRKIFIRKTDAVMMAGGLAYGTLFMIAVGIWFAFHGFGFRAAFVAAAGWLGYAVPAGAAWIRYRSKPGDAAMISIDRKESVRLAFLGWAAISIACFGVNAAFFGTDLFLNVLWAWMPMVGLLTWPLMEASYAWMIASWGSVRAEV